MLRMTFLMCVLASGVSAGPIFPNSVASNDLDFIRADDPGACWSIAQVGQGRTEMYDPRTNLLHVDGALHFDVSYSGQTIRINVHPEIGDPATRAQQAAASVSRLPVLMRSELRSVNILHGDGGAWAEDAGRFFTLYDGLMTRRLAEHDLDETVFHETAHVALDPILASDPDWQSNQRSDGDFVTQYAAANPNKEDIAETALFAWTMKFHPDRLPEGLQATLRATIPNRLEYLGNMLDGFEPPRCGS